jgi:phage terminase small subunit
MKAGATCIPGQQRRQRFVQEYLIDLNGTQAAIRAGYSPRGAEVTAFRLLRDAKTVAALKAALDKRAARTGITQDRVLEETALLAFSDLTHYTVSDTGDVELTKDAPAGAMRALQSIKRKIVTRGAGATKEVIREVEIRLWDKPGPLKLSGQHVGLFVDKQEHSGPGGGPIEFSEARGYIAAKLEQFTTPAKAR